MWANLFCAWYWNVLSRYYDDTCDAEIIWTHVDINHCPWKSLSLYANTNHHQNPTEFTKIVRLKTVIVSTQQPEIFILICVKYSVSSKFFHFVFRIFVKIFGRFMISKYDFLPKSFRYVFCCLHSVILVSLNTWKCRDPIVDSSVTWTLTRSS